MSSVTSEVTLILDANQTLSFFHILWIFTSVFILSLASCLCSSSVLIRSYAFTEYLDLALDLHFSYFFFSFPSLHPYPTLKNLFCSKHVASNNVLTKSLLPSFKLNVFLVDR